MISSRYATPLASILLVGCISTTQVYEAKSTGPWEQIHLSCSGPQSWYTLKLTKNANVELAVSRETQGTYLRITFLMKNGSSIKLLTPEVQVEYPHGPINKIAITAFTRRPLRPMQERTAAPTQNEIAATDQIIGTDTFEKIPQPYNPGPYDYFTTSIEVSPEVLSAFKTRLPPLLVDGVRTEIPDVLFEYKSTRYVQCVQ